AAGAGAGRHPTAEVAAELDRLGRERAGQVLALKPWRVMRDDIAARGSQSSSGVDPAHPGGSSSFRIGFPAGATNQVSLG
uniref:hypothetical protein n=1 Tax=Nocardia farcinica TaxID=37329 RepID=UPI002457A765